MVLIQQVVDGLLEASAQGLKQHFIAGTPCNLSSCILLSKKLPKGQSVIPMCVLMDKFARHEIHVNAE